MVDRYIPEMVNHVITIITIDQLSSNFIDIHLPSFLLNAADCDCLCDADSQGDPFFFIDLETIMRMRTEIIEDN